MSLYCQKMGLSCLWVGHAALRASSGNQQLNPYHLSFTRMCMAGFTWQLKHIIDAFCQMLLSFHQSEDLDSKNSFPAAHIWHEFIVSTKSKMALEGDRRVNVKDPWVPAKLGSPPWALKFGISLNCKRNFFFFTRLSFSTWPRLRKGIITSLKTKAFASCQH